MKTLAKVAGLMVLLLIYGTLALVFFIYDKTVDGLGLGIRAVDWLTDHCV